MTCPSRRSRAYDVVFFIALLATAMALGAALAHAFELPNKMKMPVADYFVMQKAYNGWDHLAYLLLVELLAMIVVTVMSRGARSVFWPCLFAIVFLACAQADSWAFTFPANVATENWTHIPDNWRALRDQWEYSHAVGAGFQLLAMASLIIAVIRRANVQ